MFMNKTFRKHIVKTDNQVKQRFEILMKQMLEKNPIDENLKNTIHLKWIGLMNNYKHCKERANRKKFLLYFLPYLLNSYSSPNLYLCEHGQTKILPILFFFS